MSRTDHQAYAKNQAVRLAIITISDTRTPETDTSGHYLRTAAEQAGHSVVATTIVRDEKEQIWQAYTQFLPLAQVIISTGGTGITGRDVTIPVAESLIDKPMPGFGELFRMLSYQQVRGAAMLSRAVGGLSGQTLVFALPGSLNAVETAWESLLKDELSHLVFEVFR